MYICLMTKISFPEWLIDQLRVRNLIPNDITKRTGLSSGHVSRILSGERQPGIDAIIAISETLRVPRIEVLRAAGYLDNQGQSDFDVISLAHKISMLPMDQQKFIDSLIETIISKSKEMESIEKKKPLPAE